MAQYVQPLTIQVTTPLRRLHKRLLAAWPHDARHATARLHAIRKIAHHITNELSTLYTGEVSVFVSNEAHTFHEPAQGFFYDQARQRIVRKATKQPALLYVHYAIAESMEDKEETLTTQQTVPLSRIEQIKQWQKETVKAVFQAMADTFLTMEAQTALRGAMAGLNKLGALLNQAKTKTVARDIASTLSDLRSSLSTASGTSLKPPTQSQLAIREQLGKLDSFIPAQQKAAVKAAPRRQAKALVKTSPQRMARISVQRLRQLSKPTVTLGAINIVPNRITLRHAAIPARTPPRFHINRAAITRLRITPPIIAACSRHAPKTSGQAVISRTPLRRPPAMYAAILPLRQATLLAHARTPLSPITNPTFTQRNATAEVHHAPITPSVSEQSTTQVITSAQAETLHTHIEQTAQPVIEQQGSIAPVTIAATPIETPPTLVESQQTESQQSPSELFAKTDLEPLKPVEVVINEAPPVTVQTPILNVKPDNSTGNMDPSNPAEVQQAPAHTPLQPTEQQPTLPVDLPKPPIVTPAPSTNVVAFPQPDKTKTKTPPAPVENPDRIELPHRGDRNNVVDIRDKVPPRSTQKAIEAFVEDGSRKYSGGGSRFYEAHQLDISVRRNPTSSPPLVFTAKNDAPLPDPPEAQNPGKSKRGWAIDKGCG